MLDNQRSIYKRSRYSQFGLQLWLDGSAVDNFEVDAQNRCSLARDRSQYLRNFDQSDDTKKPLYILAAINSLPALRFDGVDDFMNFADPTLSWLNNSSFTVFYVATKTAELSNSFVIGGTASGTRANLALGYLSTNTYRVVFGNDDASAVVPVATAGQPELYTLRYDISDNRREVRRNGSTVGLGASGGSLSGMTGQTLGRYLSNFGQFDLGELIIYNRTLSDYEIGQVERDLISKWTIV